MRLRPVCVTLYVTLAATASWAAVPAQAEPFTPGCTLPFAAIATAHSLDNSCPIEGEGSAKSQLQNQAKNNFCAAGVATILTYQNFKSLQTAANNAKNAGTTSFGCPTCLPADRSPLRDMFTLPNGTKVGEGSLVRYVDSSLTRATRTRVAGKRTAERRSNSNYLGGENDAICQTRFGSADVDVTGGSGGRPGGRGECGDRPLVGGIYFQRPRGSG